MTPSTKPAGLGAALDQQYAIFHDDLDRARTLVRDAVERLQSGFIGMRRHIDAQSSLLNRILERLAEPGGEPDAERTFADDLVNALGQFADQAARTNSSSNAMLRQVESISQRLCDVERAVRGIEAIALHIRLVSFNASIESARAGETGAGFAVVASEIRRLAASVEETSRSIRSSVDASRRGVEGAQAAIAEIASFDTRFAEEARERADAMIREAADLKLFIGSHARDATRASHELGSAVRQATTGLQFEDLVTQILGHMDEQLRRVARLTTESAAGAGRCGPEEALQAMLESASGPTAQESMEAGEVTLF